MNSGLSERPILGDSMLMETRLELPIKLAEHIQKQTKQGENVEDYLKRVTDYENGE